MIALVAVSAKGLIGAVYTAIIVTNSIPKEPNVSSIGAQNLPRNLKNPRSTSTAENNVKPTNYI